MKIRVACGYDADAVKALCEKGDSVFSKESYVQSLMHAWDQVSDLLKRGNVLVATNDEGEVKGFVSFERYKEFVHLGNLYVDDDARGTGTGRALIERAQKVAKDEGLTVMLGVVSGDAPAFYERLGYRAIGTVMEKHLE